MTSDQFNVKQTRLIAGVVAKDVHLILINAEHLFLERFYLV